MASKPRIIRKYANRRLYDTETSKHINKDGLRRVISGGEEIQVIDDATGADVTRKILLQLVSEQELGGRPLMTNRMLIQIIRFCDHPMQGVFGTWLQQSFDLFFEHQQMIHDQMRTLVRSGPLATFRAWATGPLGMLNSLQGAKDEDESQAE